MAIFMPNARRKHRRFNYSPRYYNPEKDDNIKRRMRIQSRSQRHRRSPLGLIMLLALLGMAVYIYMALG